MRLYIDLSCFNRPFDDQRQAERIRRETEAVLAVLRRIVEGRDTLLGSWVLTFENDKHPRLDRRDEIALWEGRSESQSPWTLILKAKLGSSQKGEFPLWMQRISRRPKLEARTSF